MADGWIGVPLAYSSASKNGTPVAMRNRGIYFKGDLDSLELSYGNFIMYNYFTYQFWLKPDSTNDTRSIY